MTAAPAHSAVALEGPPDPDLIRIRDLIYQVAGIFHPDTKLRLLLDRCGRRMKELNTVSLREHFEHLTVRPTRQVELIAPAERDHNRGNLFLPKPATTGRIATGRPSQSN